MLDFEGRVVVFFKAMADNYKDTLNLPRTDFPMKRTFPKGNLKSLTSGKKKRFMKSCKAGATPQKHIFFMTDHPMQTAIYIWDTR